MDSIFGETLPFRSMKQIQSHLGELAAKYPEQARPYEIGRSSGGNAITVLEISNDLRMSHVKPAIKIIGSVHGNEIVGAEIGMALGDFLLTHNHLDDDIRRILDRYSIHLLPMLNPDGAVLAKPGVCNSKVKS